MIELVFTIDCEIYGNGIGSLRELVFEPTRQLMAAFKEHNRKFVVFAEAAELLKIEEFQADEAVNDVKSQLRQLYNEGFEVGLHLHPQWWNARRENGRWLLDSREYNLCTLPSEKMEEIVSGSIAYMRGALGAPGFVPLSYRAGNWLMQPTKKVAAVLFKHGIRIDSSLFKGGRQRSHGLDYRPASKNAYYWRFAADVNRPDPAGLLFEVPIHSEMQPFWRMFSAKRLGVQKRNVASGNGQASLTRLLDFARPFYPRKLDFCRLRYGELQAVMEKIILEDKQCPHIYKPIVAIGHSKDLVEFDTIRRFLRYLEQRTIPVTGFDAVLRML